MTSTSRNVRTCRRFRARRTLGSTTAFRRAPRASSDSAGAEPGKGESQRWPRPSRRGQPSRYWVHCREAVSRHPRLTKNPYQASRARTRTPRLLGVSWLDQLLRPTPKPHEPTMTPDEQLRAEEKQRHRQEQDEKREAEEPKPKNWDVNP